MTRRTSLVSGSAALLALGFPGHLAAQAITANAALMAFAQGSPIMAGGVHLTIDAVAEDGYKVPVTIASDGALALMIVAPENPVPSVVLASFGALAAEHRLSTRIRLARTQEVLGLARMPDGVVRQTRQRVDVIIGGCGA